MNAFALALSTGNFSVGGVCTDCMIAYENDDRTGNSEDWDATQFERTLEEHDATHGHPHDSEWYTDCSHAGESCADDCDCQRTEFDTSPCGMCGTWLHGAREDYIFIARALLVAHV